MSNPLTSLGLIGGAMGVTGINGPMGLIDGPMSIVGNSSALPAGSTSQTTATATDTGSTTSTNRPSTSSSVASNADVVGGVNVADTSGAIVNNAEAFIDAREGNLSDRVEDVDANAQGTNIDGTEYNMDADGLNVAAATAGVDTAASVTKPNSATTYEASTAFDSVYANQAEAATMDTNEKAIVDAEGIVLDQDGLATGRNEDGSINTTGVALNDFAHQNISTVIDTSTIAGKMLAQNLGEGNYTDSKSTVKGQLEILTAEFTDSVTGEPKIPTWAAGISRSVSRSIAFKGMTGSAATSVLAQAMIEATLPIAQADSKFYQTLTVKNLDNKQQMIINKANVLSKMELANLDVRTSLAVNNAKTFMQYDMANLENEQQAEIINTQSKVQAILEDANQTNVARRFNAEAQNDMDMFYDNLGATIDMYNTSQRNEIEMFNTGERNEISQFNSSLENAREQFYMNMQYKIDESNAKWRQTVTLTNSEMQFQAAATDVKNILGLTTESLNQLWDRTDSLLDYAWKQGENEKDRELELEMAKMELQAAREAAKASGKAGIMGAVGSLMGSKAGSAAIMGGLSKVGGAIAGLFSDERLKTNIRHYETLDNGVKLYSWEWNDIALQKGAGDLPTHGVIAQDIQKQFPEAVHRGSDGYLRVDYSKVAA